MASRSLFLSHLLAGVVSKQTHIRKIAKEKAQLAKWQLGFLMKVFSHPRSIDKQCRYTDIALAVKKNEKATSVLDVGAGGNGISEYLNSSRYTIFLLDIRKDAFTNTFVKKKNVEPIVGDGTRLPFKDRAVDFVVCAATLEHIRRQKRHEFLVELKRVCKRKVLLHFPVESGNGLFKGKEYDLKFQDAHKRIYGFEESWTAEHIEKGYPRVNEVRELLPEVEIIGRKNCDVWLRYRVLSARPLIGALSGLIYCLVWKKKDNKPPYLECMIQYTKDHDEVLW